jgi:hypothetical protein
VPVSVGYRHLAFIESTLSYEGLEHLPQTVLVFELSDKYQLFRRKWPQDQSSILTALLIQIIQCFITSRFALVKWYFALAIVYSPGYVIAQGYAIARAIETTTLAFS